MAAGTRRDEVGQRRSGGAPSGRGIVRAGSASGSGSASASGSTKEIDGVWTIPELAEHWAGTTASAIADASTLGVPVGVLAVGWRVHWGAWVVDGGSMPDFSDLSRVPRGREGDEQAWVHHLGPRRLTGFVGLLRRDLEALAEDGGAVGVREVDGRCLQIGGCGRLIEPESVTVDLAQLRVRIDDVRRADGEMGGDAVASVGLAELIADRSGAWHAEEFAVALRAWQALALEGWQAPRRATTRRGQVLEWLRSHEPGLSSEAQGRIATVLNPHKHGGRPKKPRSTR